MLPALHGSCMFLSGPGTTAVVCCARPACLAALQPGVHCQRALPSVGIAAAASAHRENSVRQLTSTTRGITLPCSYCNLEVTASGACPQLECWSAAGSCKLLHNSWPQALPDMQVLQCSGHCRQQLEGLLLSAQYPSSNQACRLLTCRCCHLEISASEASQQLEGLLQKATTREADQQHRQQGSVLRIPTEPPSE